MNHSHISADPREDIYYRFYGVDISLSDSKAWDGILFGSSFKPYFVTGNLAKGEAHFKGNGKIGIYVETLSTHYWHFSATWDWELVIEEKA